MKFLLNLFIWLSLAAAASCQSNTVLICTGKSSYAYHDHRCQGLTQCHAEIKKIGLSDAKSMGRKPCGYCYKTGIQESQQTVKPAVRTTAPSQCTAITKKGTRCSRTSRSNGRCWQHGG